MKICLVSTFYPPYHVGGACLHVYYLANALAKKGHLVHVIYCRDSYLLKRGNKKPTGSFKNHHNITLHPLSSGIGIISPLSTYLTGFPLFKKKIKSIIEKERFDIIHYHNISLLGIKIFDFGQCPKIYTSHDTWLVDKKSATIAAGKKTLASFRPPQLFRNVGLIKKKIKKLSAIICPSEFNRDFLISKGIGFDRFEIIPNFVEMHQIDAKIDEKDYFLYAGRLDHLKGIKSLLYAFKDTSIKDRLFIAGSGELKKFILEFIERWNLQDKIIYLGLKTPLELAPYYKNAKAYILPSICYENCPLGVLDALSFGTPSIVSDKGGSKEIVDKIGQGLIFRAGDKNDMVKKISLFDSSLYDKKSLKKIFDENYSIDAFLENYFRLITNLVE